MESLADKMANNPQAYEGFDLTDAGDAAEDNALSAVFRGKAALLGIEIHVRGNVYCKPPKLKQERMLVKGETALMDGEMQTAFDILEEAALSLLFVREGDGFRSATREDIEEEFNSGDLMAILSGSLGVSLEESNGGNA